MELEKQKNIGASILLRLLFIGGVPTFLTLALILIAIFAAIMAVFSHQQEEQSTNIGGGIGGTAAVTQSVLRYEPLVREAAKKYGVEDHVQLLLAKMMQESGGRVPDVLQSSESIGLPPNTITDPAVSIDVGVRYFAKVLKQAGGDVKLTLQSYNFGSGFINYCKTRGGYSKQNAVAFSNMMAAKMGWKRYGDVNYVDHVLRYLKGASPSTPVNTGVAMSGGSAAVASYYLNTFRISTPFAPNGINDGVHGARGHRGIDLAGKTSGGAMGKPVLSVTDGVVEQVLINNPEAGNGVRIRSGNIQYSYIHMQHAPPVKVGQKVKAGDQIGNIGSTGFSTGAHLDFKIRDYGNGGAFIDPEKVLKQMMAKK
ncbi:hypothetical protein BMEGG_06139 [Priestia megaterium]|uniref:lysozyme family protein n=1 Tax=Priestia megaterium TaxID=1404 RepID=UPI002F6C8B60